MVIFGGAPGRVIAVQDPMTVLTTRTLGINGKPWKFESYKAILTRVAVARQANYQFMHTLGDGIYLYVFGDRVGQMVISGIAFGASCDAPVNAKNPQKPPAITGAEQILKFYEDNKVSKRESPVSITLGISTTLLGYLGQMQIEASDPETRMFQFSLPFTIIPTA